MGDQPDSWARRKRQIIYSSVSFIFILAISALIIFPISGALGIEGSVSYIWEQGKEDNKNKSEFTQIYDLILSRRLQPFYDASLKFEFRSETKGDNEQDREKTQLLPSLNMKLGNDMTDLNMGWSKDVITDTETYTGEDRDYTHEKAYAGLNWRPKWLPHILWQFQRNKRKETWGNEPRNEESDDRFNFIEDYTLRFGPLTLDHNFDHEIRQIDGNETTNYELLNRVNIRPDFSFFDDRLYISTGYELIQDREKKNEDKDTIDAWKNNLNFNATVYPADWIRPELRIFWGDIDTDFPDRTENDPNKTENDPDLPDNREIIPDQRETTFEHDLTFLLMPHPYFSTTLGVYYNRFDKRLDSLPKKARELGTVSIKLDPQIQGLIFDPNISMYPIMTSILISSSTERNEGRVSHIQSLLFTGATTIYEGVDFDLDLSLVQRKDPNIKSIEEQVDSYLKLDLLPNLKGSVNQKAKWRTDRGGSALDEGHYFDGDIDSRLIYRPVKTFMIDIAYMVDYDDQIYSDSWQYNINWRPSLKMELDLRYQTGSEDRKRYFLGELNLYMTDAIHLELRYQSPSEDQKLKVEFNMRF